MGLLIFSQFSPMSFVSGVTWTWFRIDHNIADCD